MARKSTRGRKSHNHHQRLADQRRAHTPSAPADQGDALQELLETPAGRRALSRASPVFFDTTYCGMRAAPHRTRWLDTIDRVWQEARTTGRKRKVLFLAPRYHGKSEAGISIALRAICLDRNVRILWISEALDPAAKRLRRLKTLLRSELVLQDWCTAPDEGFGPWRDSDEDKWTSDQIYVARDLQSIDPTMCAVGAGGAVTGGHFDLIICHERGTPMLHDGEWIPVEQHPSFQGYRNSTGVE
ncbi:MAG: hypothetical protein KC492_15755, partial [Myxococcales bacterium]|nr:hypothetical protein [Myxococcales bacterium]